MRKINIIFFLLFLSISYGQNFGSFASGVKINNTIYNISGTGLNQINPNFDAQNFDGVLLGSFGQNSTCAKITAGEVKTFKTASGNVCSATLNWRVYLASAAPSGTFNLIPLPLLIDCNLGTNTFNDGFGPCNNGDQKWKDYSLTTDFTTGLLPGNYVLEVFYTYSGSDSSTSTCETTKFINNLGANYKANFSISNPTSNPTVSTTSICEGSTLTLTANPANGVAPYSFSWTGPNGYVSSFENPTIVTTLANSGVYSLIITDACGAVSIIQNTQTVVVNEKITPVFDALYPVICNGGNPPILPNLSTNGISGTWNPATVSNTASASYLFTPDAGQCANTFTQFIIVINNVTPSFTLPSFFCQGTTPPLLPTTSNNGVLGTWNPATVSSSGGTYVFTPSAGQCANVRTITISVTPNLTPIFTIPTFICVGATPPILPTMSTNGVSGTWNPSTVSNTTTNAYTFTPAAGTCATIVTVTITVNPNLLPTFTPINPICQNATLPLLPTTSNNGITGTWNPSIVSNTASGTYTFTPTLGLCAITTTLDVIVNPNITPLFTAIPEICYQSTVPVLPTTSNNGITGTWNPLIISNTASGTYTFTPTAGLCAIPITISVSVLIINPIFTVIPPICAGDIAPTLQGTSNNGIIGTWNPSVINNTTSGTYTFTPNPGQCATTATLNVTVNQLITPTFNTIAPICENGTVPLLQTTSNNNITGTWNPSAINNTASGAYLFTPDANQCAANVTINVTITPNVTPVFSPIAPICANATSPILPLTSTNNIAGTWSPSTVNNTATGTYTFTPNAGICATQATLTVVVNPNITPIFDSFPIICIGSTPPLLPGMSNNGISGTWNPAVVSNTASGIYTFTPNTGLCATILTINITVGPNIVTTFDQLPPVCFGSVAPIFPLVSTNGITGTWNPTIISNTTSGNYTFTPNPNQCASTFVMSITVTIITPTFDVIPPICFGATAPLLLTTSNNGITGTWNPSVLSSTLPGTYTFTPDSGQCAIVITINTTINTITPTFTPIPNVCFGTIAPLLQSTSNNGITGTWNPSIASTTSSGTYTFTPDANQCAIVTSITINVTTITPIFSINSTFCENATVPILPIISNNSITGTWNPSIVSNTTSGTYVFTPNSGQCALTYSIEIIVNPNITPIFDPINTICFGTTVPVLPTTSNNGINGSWNPSVISNSNSGSYTFTPNVGICATSITITIDVNTIVPVFEPIGDICFGSTVPLLSLISTNQISGTWNPSNISNTTSGTYTFTPNPNQCATTITISINVNSITPTFDPIAPICQNAVSPFLETTSNNGILGIWNPATISNTNSGTYTFTPNANQCAIVTSITVTVNPNVLPIFNPILPICENAAAPILSDTSINGIAGTWNPSTVSNTASNTYFFTPNNGLCALPTSIEIIVTPNTIPTFDPIGPFCENATPSQLPNTSLNGITGTWNPLTINTTTTGSYTFTPVDNSSGICALPVTINIIIIPNVTPTFDAILDVCYGTSNIPVLPLLSNEQIAGTWNPSAISNTASGTYIFTPNAGECATTATLSVTVNTITPSFDVIVPICENSFAPQLATTSNNGITGTWNPSLISNTNTATYTFTPNADQCAIVVSITVTVNPNVLPIFNAIPSFCENTLAPELPAISNNGISGTWNPALVSNTTSDTYFFTPDAGLCALPTSISIVVNSTTIPTFDPIGPFCENALPISFPTTSLNGIIGTWNPAIINTTSTGNYIFTPLADTSGICAIPITIEIIIIPNTIPTFNAIPDVCFGTALIPTLPLTSTNGITGTWNPAVISAVLAGTYTFTPDASFCATTATLNVGINVVTPVFNPIPDVCFGSNPPTLPQTSVNGITGTWNPATINNTVSGSYFFTPDAEQCAIPTTITVNVTSVTPTFNPIAPICENSTAPILPLTSTNSITGTWNPAIVSNTTTGSYTFIPDANQCATAAVITVIVNTKTVPTFIYPLTSTVCQGFSAQVLIASTSNNGISGTWNPNTIDYSILGTTTYIFTPNSNECATATQFDVTVNPNITPQFNPIAPICSGEPNPILPLTSVNGYTGLWTPSIVSTTASATYTFTPTTGQCATTTTLSVTVLPSPTTIEAIITNVFNGVSNGSIEITGVTGGISPYNYSLNGSNFTSSTIYNNLSPGDYTITVKDGNGCEYTETFTIDSSCIFPKGISPNDDGLNDTFNLNDCSVVKLVLFNRYGVKVNSYETYTNQWDGKSKAGEILPDGTYYYTAEISDGNSKTGWVYIAR